jgi:hypothetical protein
MHGTEPIMLQALASRREKGNFAQAHKTCSCLLSTLNIKVLLGPYSSVGSDSLRAGRSGDRIPVGARLSTPFHTGPGAQPTSYAIGYRIIPRCKAAGAWRWPPIPPSVEVGKNRAMPPLPLWASCRVKFIKVPFKICGSEWGLYWKLRNADINEYLSINFLKNPLFYLK